MTGNKQITGTCLCGAVTIVLKDPVGWIGVCHCRMCQRWSGSLWAGFPAPASAVAVSGPVKHYASSAIAQRAFCDVCGSHLWMRDVADDGSYDLMPGLFDETQDWPLHSEIYTDQAMKAFPLSGDHKRATCAEYQAKNPEVKAIGL